jgi:D-alanyl-D-alanine dipeptidase
MDLKGETLLFVLGAGVVGLFGLGAVKDLEPPPQPPPCPRHLAGLVGAYGQSELPLYVFERAGKLYVLSAGAVIGPLAEPSSDLFKAPAPGLRAGDTLTFSRDLDGTAAAVRVGSAILGRLSLGVEGQGTYRVTPLRPVDELTREALASEPPPEPQSLRKPDLVELDHLDPTLKLDIRYATAANFLGTPVYSEARAFLQRPAARALVRAHRALSAFGYGLLIHDAYRPWYVTKVFWDATPLDKREFVADPAKGSRHNRGCAVDLTLYDRGTGRAVEMPGVYDEMSDRSHPDFVGGTGIQRWRRDLLRQAMEREGFSVFEVEWWHFDYKEWRSYPILNLTFDRIPASLLP